MNPQYLLDTCALLALSEGGKHFSPMVRQRLEVPGSVVYVSAISAFEIGQKASAGKLTLPCPLTQWFAAMLQHHELTELPVSSSISITATSLPTLHKDPFDRLIIAAAIEKNLTIITSDQTIQKYPEITTLW